MLRFKICSIIDIGRFYHMLIAPAQPVQRITTPMLFRIYSLGPSTAKIVKEREGDNLLNSPVF